MAATATTAGLQAPGNQEVSDSTTTAQAICAVDAGNYGWVSVHVTAQGGSSTVTFQVSNDNSNWVPITLQPPNAVSPIPISSTTGTGVWNGQLAARYFRINVTGIASGTTSAVVELSSTNRSAAAQASAITPMNPTTFNLTAAASTNATSVKASAGSLHSVVVTNIAAAARYLKIYDKASAPTVGTDIPILTIPLATAPSMAALTFGTLGKRLTLGIALATTVNQIDTDATAVTAGDLKISLDYV